MKMKNGNFKVFPENDKAIRKVKKTMMEERHMDPMDLIRDKFSQDCTIETVLHLLMAHFDLSEK